MSSFIHDELAKEKEEERGKRVSEVIQKITAIVEQEKLDIQDVQDVIISLQTSYTNKLLKMLTK